MSFALKAGILVAVALVELVVTVLVGVRLMSRGQLPAVLALAMSSVATVAIVGYILFAVVE